MLNTLFIKTYSVFDNQKVSQHIISQDDTVIIILYTYYVVVADDISSSWNMHMITSILLLPWPFQSNQNTIKIGTLINCFLVNQIHLSSEYSCTIYLFFCLGTVVSLSVLICTKKLPVCNVWMFNGNPQEADT